jgi:hypothetical protein
LRCFKDGLSIRDTPARIYFHLGGEITVAQPAVLLVLTVAIHSRIRSWYTRPWHEEHAAALDRYPDLGGTAAGT